MDRFIGNGHLTVDNLSLVKKKRYIKVDKIVNVPPKIHYNPFELISRFVSFVVCGTFVIPIFRVIDLNSYESTLKISLFLKL